MIASLLRIPSVRQHAIIANVPTETTAPCLIVTVMLLAIALDQSCGSATAPAVGAAAGAFALERQRTAWLDMSNNAGYLAAIAVSVWAIADLRPATAVLALATAATAATIHAADAISTSPNAAGTAA